ncbi:MAG: DoxX family protein [Candidatus Eremiobacteraeota bacterium]|nr:DoxX family protein [Candidatus Eremiobacteraeota bacterium]
MTQDFGLLLVRVIIGVGIAIHGSQKLFGWFGGHGIKGTGQFMESLGFRPGVAFATLSGLGEFVGGVLVLFGFLGPVGPALIVSVMTVAIVTVHLRNGFLSSNQGYELPLVYIAGALAAAFTSSSIFTLDHLLGVTLLHSNAATWACVAIGLVAGVLTVFVRRLPARGHAEAA